MEEPRMDNSAEVIEAAESNDGKPIEIAPNFQIKELENYDFDSDDEVMTSDITNGHVSHDKNLSPTSDPDISSSDSSSDSSISTEKETKASMNGDFKFSEVTPQNYKEKDVNIVNEIHKSIACTTNINHSTVTSEEAKDIEEVQTEQDFEAKNDKLSEIDQLSDQSLEDGTNSPSDSLILQFPTGESYDLRDVESHNEILRLTKKIFNTCEYEKEANAKNEKEIAHRSQKIFQLNAHNKELVEGNKKMEVKIESQVKELEKREEMLKSNHNAARAAINRLHKESDDQIKSLKAQCLAMQKEKDSAVMNFARREKELLDAKRVAEVSEKKGREAMRERDKLTTQMRGMKMDLVKMKAVLEKKESEAAHYKRESEKIKEDTSSQLIKVKWAQNKLKSETDSHNETKEKLAKALTEIKQAKEETEQIRMNCQGMIKTYQESEEMRSNSLDSQLKEKEMLLSQQEAKSGELEGIHKQQMEELRRLKQKHKDALEENVVMKTRVECLEKERLKNEETLRGYSEILNRQKKEALSANDQIKELEEVRAQREAANEEMARMKVMLTSEQETKEQMWRNEEAWKIKEQELLEFTQRVSSKNAQLTSECENLSSKLETMTRNNSESGELVSRLQEKLKTVLSELDQQKNMASDTSSELSKRLEDKEMTVNQLTLQLDEIKDEIRTLKRKNNANIKDLTRQLQHARKKLEPYESSMFPPPSGSTTEDGSMGSRASSDTSLDCVGKTTNANNISVLSHNSAVETTNFSSNSTNGNMEVPDTVVTTIGEINKQALIERIVRLQRIHARKNEKIDFLQDHVHQLVDEMQKKNKIIQHYILREESGMLMHENALSHHVATDHTGKMSRHLSMEVNRKMQSVLEDTLLKNIALKESIDALGKEIARLSTNLKS